MADIVGINLPDKKNKPGTMDRVAQALGFLEKGASFAGNTGLFKNLFDTKVTGVKK